jgi:uncharacterized protein (TIGR03084 family)
MPVRGRPTAAQALIGLAGDSTVQTGDVFDDLAAEQDALEAVLAVLDQDAWCHASGAAGWTVADVVLHLAQTEEYVIASVTGNEAALLVRDRDRPPLDELMDQLVAGQRCAPSAAVFNRWQTARRAALAALRACPSTVRLRWATIPLTPRTLATTRLAEHWAHALDVTVALGISYPDTVQLWHVAWLAHRSLPYAFAVAGEHAVPVRCELLVPDGQRWQFGPVDAPSLIAGPAGTFCRVGARRLPAERSGLTVAGPHGAAALRVLRTYAI